MICASEIATLLKQSIIDAPDVLDAFTAHCGKAPTVEVGFDKRRQDWTKISPFIVCLPLSEGPSDAGTHHVFEIGLTIGIVEKDIENAFTFLGKVALPSILATFDAALTRLVESAQIQTTATDYSQEEAPLIYISAMITVAKPIYVGARR